MTSLSVHPKEDMFISSSEDGTIRLWSMDSPYSIGVLRCINRFAGNPIAVYDAEAMVFAVYSDDGYIRLFDSREVSNGPFIKFHLFRKEIVSKIGGSLEAHGLPLEELYVTKIQFSRDGSLLLVMTNINAMIILDSYEGQLNRIHCSFNEGRLGAGFSADGQFIAMGTSSGYWTVSFCLTPS